MQIQMPYKYINHLTPNDIPHSITIESDFPENQPEIELKLFTLTIVP